MDRDLLRQTWVTASAILCVYGTLLGFGVIGTRVQDSSSGVLSAQATVLAPGTPAFSIWSLIYLGLFAYVGWQWLPSRRTAERARRTGWLAGVSMILNAAWILVTQVGWIWVSVGVILALALVLGVLVKRLAVLPDADSLGERVVVDGTFGAYLGWVSVASCANIAAAGRASGWTLGPLGDQILGAVVLAVAATLGIVFARQLGGRLAVALAMGWGLAWIGVARLATMPHSPVVGAAAIAAASVVVGSVLIARRPVPARRTV